MGYCGSSHQDRAFSAGKDHTYSEAIYPVISGSYCESAWNSKDNHFRPGSQFIARFWEHFHAALGTQLLRSSAYHPQTDGQTERINQILEDMLRACVLKYNQKWDECLLITIVIKKASRWLHLRPYMDGNAEHHWIGQKLGREISLGPIWLMKQKNRFGSFRKI